MRDSLLKHEGPGGPLRRSIVNKSLRTLIRSDDPSIRWKVRVRVYGEERDSRSIRALEEEIRKSPRVRALLSRMTELGRPGTAKKVYYKWQGIHWVLASLADLGYPVGDETLYPMQDRILEFWLRPSYFQEYVARTRADTHRVGVPLLRGRYRRCASQQGNALFYLTELGIADERSDSLAERLLHWQWDDGGWNCDTHPEADTSSFMETLLPMVGLSAYAAARESSRARTAATKAAEVFLRRRLYKRARDGRVIDPVYVKLHYPLYYHYDFLGGLKAMVRVGKIEDRRCSDALDLLERKSLAAGGWPAESRYYRGTAQSFTANAEYAEWGDVGSRQMNEWVTADALWVLSAAGRIAV